MKNKIAYSVALLVVVASACKPNPLSNKATERAAAEICSNNVVGLTRIVLVEHKEGSTNAVVTYEHVNTKGGIERQELFLAYTTNVWGLDWCRYRAIEDARERAHQKALAELFEKGRALDAAPAPKPTGPLRRVFMLTNGGTLVGDVLPASASGQGVQVKTGEGQYERVPWTMFSQEDLKTFAKDQRMQPFIRADRQ